MKWFLSLLVALVLAAPAAAQDRPSLPGRDSPDFLFARPDASVTVRGSWLFARSGSDWYNFVTDLLTLDSKDFNAPGFGFDANVPLTRRLDVQVSFDINRVSNLSEYRDWVDNNRLPIEQQTTLREINLGGNIRYALTDRVRQVGNFVWVPRRIVPFVGAGAGALHYKLEQSGDFVDFVDSSVFSDRFASRGWAPSAQAFAGVDVQVLTRVFVTVDGRYLWAAADLQRDWIDFDPIDLTGFRLSGGVNFVF